jgi:hypothetical protein
MGAFCLVAEGTLILKGNQRGGGQQLAAHLLNSFDNERVEVAEVRGAIARDLSGAFGEWYAHSRATKCKKYLYSLSLNPDQTQGTLSREQYLDLIARTERSLKLVNQPRAIVFHVKEGREHCHAVWSRIETGAEKIRSVQIAHDRLKLRSVVRSFAREHDLKLPPGMQPRKSPDRTAFNSAVRAEDLGEKQQQDRTGVDKKTRMAEIAACWTATDNGKDFIKALEAKHYYIAYGGEDQRDYVVIDLFGEIHSLSRQLGEVTRPKGMRQRLKDFPPKGLPDIDTTKDRVRKIREELQRRSETRPSPQVEERLTALQARQQNRRDGLTRMRLDTFARQFSERAELHNMQRAENENIASKRKPNRFTSFLARITGIGSVLAWAHGRADAKREVRHKAQIEALLRRHDHELKSLDRHEAALARLERREDRSASLALRRESCRRLRTFPLKPEFDKALGREKTSEGGSEARRLAAQFRQSAKARDFSPGDLQKLFERAHSGKQSPVEGEAGDRKKSPERPKPRPDRGRDDL